MRKVLAFLLTACAAGANATVLDLGPLAQDVPAAFAEFQAPGPFNDIFSFSTSSKGALGVSVSNFEPLANLHTILLGLGLVSNPDGVLFNGDDKLLKVGTPVGNSLALAWPDLKPGNYYIDVVGLSVGKTGGAYQGAVLTAVPEPESWALMLAGLGAVGMLARRRIS